MASKITKVPNGPLIKKKGPFKGSTLKGGGVVKAQKGKKTPKYSNINLMNWTETPSAKDSADYRTGYYKGISDIKKGMPKSKTQYNPQFGMTQQRLGYSEAYENPKKKTGGRVKKAQDGIKDTINLGKKFRAIDTIDTSGYAGGKKYFPVVRELYKKDKATGTYKKLKKTQKLSGQRMKSGIDTGWGKVHKIKKAKTGAWQRSEGKNPSGGLNAKGVASYRRENPGSKLKTAVTTKPSKLKPGSKAANRRKSFCARMSGMKKRLTSAKTANDPNSRINKSLRKWNC